MRASGVGSESRLSPRAEFPSSAVFSSSSANNAKPPCATVVVLGTGGTIAGTAASPDDNLGYVAGTVGVDALVAAVPALGGRARSRPSRSPSSTARTWTSPPGGGSRSGSRHHAARPEVAGVVVTHGTDTLEETAYFLPASSPPRKPVVLTGAMRPATSREADGPRNLADAIAVARRAGRARRASWPSPARCIRRATCARCTRRGSMRSRPATPGRSAAIEDGRLRSDARLAGGGRAAASTLLPPAERALAVGRDRRQRTPAPTAAPSVRWSTPASTASSSPPPATARSIASSPRCSSRRRAGADPGAAGDPLPRWRRRPRRTSRGRSPRPATSRR